MQERIYQVFGGRELRETEAILTRDGETKRVIAIEGWCDYGAVDVIWDSKSPWVSGEQRRCVGTYQNYGTACRELRRQVKKLVADGWANVEAAEARR